MKHPKNRIIVFANQKGGVGKSTLCILLANYLHYWKRKVCVIDTDLQQSASMQREIDKQALGGVPPYSIQSFVISDPDTMEMVMASAEEFDGYVLIDAPGNIQDDGLAVVLARADYIVCPYEYETKSLISTQTFVGVVEQLRQLNPSMTTKLFLVPNRGYQGRMEYVGGEAIRACSVWYRHSPCRLQNANAACQYLCCRC